MGAVEIEGRRDDAGLVRVPGVVAQAEFVLFEGAPVELDVGNHLVVVQAKVMLEVNGGTRLGAAIGLHGEVKLAEVAADSDAEGVVAFVLVLVLQFRGTGLECRPRGQQNEHDDGWEAH